MAASLIHPHSPDGDGEDGRKSSWRKTVCMTCAAICFALSCLVLCLVLATLATSNGESFFTAHWWPRSVFDTDSEAPHNILVIAVCIAFAANWIGWIPASALETERFYDLVGSISFVAAAVVSLGLSAGGPSSSKLSESAWRYVPSALTIVWSLRLGSFLFTRVMTSSNGDQRFDVIKRSPQSFLVAWTLQAAWCVLTSLSALTQLTSVQENVDIPEGRRLVASLVGLLLWMAGFAIEVCADHQKTQFSRVVANRGQFISTGLWSLSRHPNYFGEMLLWFGIYVMGIRYYQGSQWVCTVSPLFVVALISFVSGLPQLERRANSRWENDDAYQRYKRRTPLLVLNPFLMCDNDEDG